VEFNQLLNWSEANRREEYKYQRIELDSSEVTQNILIKTDKKLPLDS